ncbi:hypothetical protein GCM10027258_33350 [Amycolatopsis stemonae]
MISAGQFDDPALRSFSTGPDSKVLSGLLADPDIGAYEVRRLEDPTAQEMQIEIHEFFASARRDELRTLYLSSHGFKDARGRLYFAAKDTRHDLLAVTGVSAAFVAETITDSACRSIVIVLDCSYSGSFHSEIGNLRGSSSVIDPEIGGTGWIVISSASGVEYAFEVAEPTSPRSGSVFTDALIDGLRTGAADLGGDGVIDPEELFDFLYRRVVAAGEATGFRQTPSKVAALTGKLVFAHAPKVGLSPTVTSKVGVEDTVAATIEATASDERPVRTPETKVDWATDAPAREDHLNRGPLADVLASQLREVRRKDPSTSFLVHLDGPWGAGKSTLLNLLEERLGAEFTIVHFDAWRQSRLGPPWWALLSATRKAVARDRPWFSAAWLRVTETTVRARRSGAAFILAVLLLVTLIGVLTVVVLPQVPGNEAIATLAKAVTAVVAATGALWAGARVAAKLLLWDSARGARLFEQSNPNPMDQVASHFGWLLRRSREPVLLFVDDLDRCPGTYVVDLLDSVQTLVRDAPHRDADSPNGAAAYFVVAADGAWLRRSYEDAFPTFRDCVPTSGSSLGHLFLDKLFQLTVPVPAPSSQARATYLDQLLHVPDTADTEQVRREVEMGKEAISEVDDEDAILRVVRTASAPAKEELAGEAALALIAPHTRARTEHALSKFLPLLQANPRTIKKFLNTYNVLRSVRTLEQNTVPGDVLALWTILRVRWPSVADHLEAAPDTVRGIIEPLWASECFPPDLRDLATDAALRAVVLHGEGGPLTAAAIRQCTGTDVT